MAEVKSGAAEEVADAVEVRKTGLQGHMSRGVQGTGAVQARGTGAVPARQCSKTHGRLEPPAGICRQEYLHKHSKGVRCRQRQDMAKTALSCAAWHSVMEADKPHSNSKAAARNSKTIQHISKTIPGSKSRVTGRRQAVSSAYARACGPQEATENRPGKEMGHMDSRPHGHHGHMNIMATWMLYPGHRIRGHGSHTSGIIQLKEAKP